MAVLHLILLYITLPWLNVTLHDSTNLPWLYFTLYDSTLLYRGSNSLYMTLHYSTMALLYSTVLYHSLVKCLEISKELIHECVTMPGCCCRMPLLHNHLMDSCSYTQKCIIRRQRGVRLHPPYPSESATDSTMAILHSTRLYITLPWLYLTLLYCTLLYSDSTSL